MFFKVGQMCHFSLLSSRCWSSVSSLLPLWKWCWTHTPPSLPVSGWTLCPPSCTRWAAGSVKSPSPLRVHGLMLKFCFFFYTCFCFFPPCLRSTDPSSTWCVSGAVSLALCSISVDAPYACASEPDVTQRSVNWTFPALWGITCCCVTTGRSTDFTVCKYFIPAWCLFGNTSYFR